MSKIAICGATGAVGKELIQCIYHQHLQADVLTLFASKRSTGQSIETPFGNLQIKEFSLQACQQYDIVFLCVGGDFSAAFAKPLLKNNNYVIDLSSRYRYDKDVPLVIPEINPKDIKIGKLIANPNCTTAILAMALYPIHKKYTLKKVIVSTYQATSGSGQEAMDELTNATRNMLKKQDFVPKKFAHNIAFNLIPLIDVVQENKYSKEEMKVVWETQKIFHDNSIKISCTAVRIPIFRAHSESVTIETAEKIDAKDVHQLLENAPGVKVVDDAKNHSYPMPLTTTHRGDIEVGRIRNNLIFQPYGIDFFICGDQLLKGAALNATQIAQLILKT